MINTRDWLVQKIENGDKEELQVLMLRMLNLLKHRSYGTYRMKEDDLVHFEFAPDKFEELDSKIITLENVFSYETDIQNYNQQHFNNLNIAKILPLKNTKNDFILYRIGAFDYLEEQRSLIFSKHVDRIFGWYFDLYFKDNILKYADYHTWDWDANPNIDLLSPSQFENLLRSKLGTE